MHVRARRRNWLGMDREKDGQVEEARIYIHVHVPARARVQGREKER